MFWDSPLWGWGNGAFAHEGFCFLTPELHPRLLTRPDFADHVHNEVLESAVEYGLLGLGLMFACIWAIFQRASLHFKNADLRFWLGASLSLGFLVAACFSDAFSLTGPLFIFAVLAAWWSNRLNPSSEKILPLHLSRILGISLLLVSAGLFWNATRTVYLDQVAYPVKRLVERLPNVPQQRIAVLNELWSRHRGEGSEALILLELGKTEQKIGHLKDAETHLKIAHQIDPSSVETCVLMGDVYAQDAHGDQDVVSTSLQAYSWALELQPDSVEILLARAKVGCREKHMSDCSSDLQHILRLQNDQHEAQAMLDELFK